MARCTLSVSCATDLDYCCFCWSGRCICWTGALNFKSLWTVYVKCLRRFALYCLSFGSRSKHHNRCSIHFRSESITGQPASKPVVMTTSGQFLDSCSCIRNESVCECCSTALFAKMFMKTLHILRTCVTNGFSFRDFRLFHDHIFCLSKAFQ